MLACVVIALVSAAHEGGASFLGVLHKTGVGTISSEIRRNLQSLLGEVEVSDGVGLYSKMGQYAGYVATGVADAFGDDALGKFVALPRDKAFGIVACDDGVEGEVATQKAGFHVYILYVYGGKDSENI